jgi:hypothetical protein
MEAIWSEKQNTSKRQGNLQFLFEAVTFYVHGSNIFLRRVSDEHAGEVTK